MPFAVWTWVTKGPLLDVVQIVPCKEAILRGRAAHCKIYGVSVVSCAKTAEPIGIWTRVGPRKYLLDGNPDPHT